LDSQPDPDTYFWFKGSSVHVFPVLWKIIQQWPQLFQACKDDELELFGDMNGAQCYAIVRVLDKKPYPDFVPDAANCQEENDCARLVHHLQIYEFACKYAIGSLAILSFRSLAAAGNKIRFYVLIGTLTKNNYIFGDKEQWFSDYVMERAKMQREPVTQNDANRIRSEFSNSMTVENLLLVQIIDSKLKDQNSQAMQNQSQ
jgi:hypothetical protein